MVPPATGPRQQQLALAVAEHRVTKCRCSAKCVYRQVMGIDSTGADDIVRGFICDADLLVSCQGERTVATEQVKHLEAALVNARRIGAAIGIIMARMNLTDDQAFEVLNKASQRRNRKMSEIAEDVLYAGAFE